MHPTSSAPLNAPSKQSPLAIHIRLVPSTSHYILSLSLPALTNPHHKFPFIHFLSPNQLPYKFKERRKVTNFARSFSVTSVTLCPQAAIYNRRQNRRHYIWKRWGEAILALAMRANRGNGGIAPLILNLGTRWSDLGVCECVTREIRYYKKLYTVLPCLGVFIFCTCCILICLVSFVASFKLSFV